MVIGSKRGGALYGLRIYRETNPPQATLFDNRTAVISIVVFVFFSIQQPLSPQLSTMAKSTVAATKQGSVPRHVS